MSRRTKKAEGTGFCPMMLHVTCDWCVNRELPTPSVLIVRASGTLFHDAAQAGWVIYPGGQDICPTCAAEEGLTPLRDHDGPIQRDLF